LEAFLIKPPAPHLPNRHRFSTNIPIIPAIFPLPIVPTIYNAHANKLELSAGTLTRPVAVRKLDVGAKSQEPGLSLSKDAAMTLTPSQKPTREWPLLILTLGLVGVICFPLWQMLSPSSFASWASWDTERWGRLLLGPEQIACYVTFVWGAFILGSRYLEVRRQRQAFSMDLLPTEDGARILQEDARPLQRKIEQVTGQRPYILANMIRIALGKFAISRSCQEVSETVRTQAEVDQGRLVASMSTVNYLAWAIPAIGFFGTVRGLAGSMTLAEQGGQQIRIATQHLTVAFDCTLVALAMSLVMMFLVHLLQGQEESLVIDCQQYCLEHLVNRIYEPESLSLPTAPHGFNGRERTPHGTVAGTLAERVPR
jgi:biopolymer transport protein ExbB/TolQ